MLRSFTLKNFRCFQDFTLEPLERVNLIAGKNNVGKTSLLEAIFIFINPRNPELPFQLNRLRGITSSIRVADIEEMRGFFYNQEVEEVIELSSSEDNNLQRVLKISLAESEEPQIISNDDDSTSFKPNESLTTEVRTYDRLVLDYQDSFGKKDTSHLSLTSQGKLLSEGRLLGVGSRPKYPLGIYITTSTNSPREDAERFSKLERVGRQDEVLETLRILEPRLQRLTLLVVDRDPIIHGDVGMRELVPLPLMGEGMRRLLSIVLAIANARGGIVLIDEVENGLHYSVMTDVWKAIAYASRLADAQIFATTHSQECILAAHKAFETSEKYDFCYHRLDRIKGQIKSITYDRETLATSDELNLEIR